MHKLITPSYPLITIINTLKPNAVQGKRIKIMSIFDSLKVYAGKWQVESLRNFTADEINAVSKAVVVASQYGNSVCFFMVNGGNTYIPLSNDSSLGVGEEVDITKAKLVTLSKQGESDIYRVSI